MKSVILIAHTRIYLVLLLSMAINSGFCQEKKSFTGKLENFGDDNLEISIGNADASYEYFLDGNQKVIFNGDFKASKVSELVDGVDKVGYSSNVSTKFLYKVSGKFDHGKKIGTWVSQKIIFGTKISGASFNAYQNNWNTLNIDNSNDVESVKTITVNYVNGILDGQAAETLTEKGRIIQSVNCTIKDNYFIGKFASKNESKSTFLVGDWNINGEFDGNGYLNGDCVAENIRNNHEVKYSFSHGILLKAVENNKATGEKLQECVDPVCEFISSKAAIPGYIKYDTIEVGKNTYTGKLSLGISLKNSNGVLYSEQNTYALNNNNICYGVNSNCIENTLPINELSVGFITKANYPKCRDIFFECDSMFSDKQFKGANHPAYISKVSKYRSDYYKITLTDPSITELPYYPENLMQVMDSKFGHGSNFGFSFFRIFINSDGTINDVVLKRVKTEIQLYDNSTKQTSSFSQDKYDLKSMVPLEDTDIINGVMKMPKWVAAKDKAGKFIPAFVDVFLWKTNTGLDIWVKNEKGYYVKNPVKAKDDVKIGMHYLDGIVAYVIQPGERGYDPLHPHGLLAYPSDQSPATVLLLDPNHSYLGGLRYTDGIENNHVILSWNKQGDYSAYLCDKLNFKQGEDWKIFDLPPHQVRHANTANENGNRWHLPTLDELKYLYLHKDEIGGFTTFNISSSHKILIIGFSHGRRY